MNSHHVTIVISTLKSSPHKPIQVIFYGGRHRSQAKRTYYREQTVMVDKKFYGVDDAAREQADSELCSHKPLKVWTPAWATYFESIRPHDVSLGAITFIHY